MPIQLSLAVRVRRAPFTLMAFAAVLSSAGAFAQTSVSQSGAATPASTRPDGKRVLGVDDYTRWRSINGVEHLRRRQVGDVRSSRSPTPRRPTRSRCCTSCGSTTSRTPKSRTRRAARSRPTGNGSPIRSIRERRTWWARRPRSRRRRYSERAPRRRDCGCKLDTRRSQRTECAAAAAAARRAAQPRDGRGSVVAGHAVVQLFGELDVTCILRRRAPRRRRRAAGGRGGAGGGGAPAGGAGRRARPPRAARRRRDPPRSRSRAATNCSAASATSRSTRTAICSPTPSTRRRATATACSCIDLESGRVNPLDNDARIYSRLTWNDAGTGLAVLKGVDVDKMRERDNVLVVYPDVQAALNSAERRRQSRSIRRRRRVSRRDWSSAIARRSTGAATASASSSA